MSRKKRFVQAEFVFDNWQETRAARKRSKRTNDQVDEEYKEAMLKIYRAYRRRFGPNCGLSERELDMASMLAAQMIQTGTQKNPRWWLNEFGVSCLGLNDPILPRKGLALLQDLDKLMDPDFAGDDDVRNHDT